MDTARINTHISGYHLDFLSFSSFLFFNLNTTACAFGLYKSHKKFSVYSTHTLILGWKMGLLMFPTRNFHFSLTHKHCWLIPLHLYLLPYCAEHIQCTLEYIIIDDSVYSSRFFISSLYKPRNKTSSVSFVHCLD